MKRLSLHEDALPGVGETTADAHGDEHAHERCVEDEVAGLAQVPPLGRDREGAPPVVPGDAVPALAQLGRGGVDGRGRDGRGILPRRHGNVDGAMVVQARQPRGRPRRLRPQRLPVVLGARQHAADERDEQQDVDRREPRRRVDVEQAELVEHRREVGVVGEVLGDAVGVGAALRDERSRDGGDRKQQQQHERGAHARELAPSPAQPPDDAEARRDDVVAGRGRGIGVVGRAEDAVGGFGHGLLPVGREVRAGVGHPASPPAESTSTCPRARSPSAGPAR